MSRAAAALSAKSVPATVSRLVTTSNSVDFDYATIEEAFPVVDPGMKPLGTTVLVQIRQPKLFSAGRIKLNDEVRKTEQYNTQVAKVIALGPLAFKMVKTTIDEKGNETEELKDWATGQWYCPGDFVWIAKYGGDRFVRVATFKRKEYNFESLRDEDVTAREEVLFAIFKAKDIHCVITDDPTKIKAFLD